MKNADIKRWWNWRLGADIQQIQTFEIWGSGNFIAWLRLTIECQFRKSNKIFSIDRGLEIQVALVICRLFICDFAYMWLKLWHFRGMYPPIYQWYWSHYMRIHYIPANFLGPYISHITRAACTIFGIELNSLPAWVIPHLKAFL